MTIVIDSNITGAILHDTEEFLFVTSKATFANAGQLNLFGTPGSVGRVTFLGQMTGGGIEDVSPNGVALELSVGSTAYITGISLRGSGNTIVSSGVIESVVFESQGTFSAATPNTLLNSGTMSNVGPAILRELRGGPNDVVTNIFNSGLIHSSLGTAIKIETGASTIENSGTVRGDIVLSDRSDSVTNTDTINGSLTLGNGGNSVFNSGAIKGFISGGANTDSFSNSGTLIGSADLGAGNNILLNEGQITGLFSAGAGNDHVLNAGVISATVNLGNGANRLINSGTIEDFLFGSTALITGTGADKITNTAAIIGDVDLGDGIDRLVNSGTIEGSVTLGAGADKLVSSGEILGDVTLGAGGGVFINTGTVEGNVTLGGAADVGFLDSRAGAIHGSIIGGGAGNTIYASMVGNSVTGGAGGDTVRGGIGDDSIATLGNFDFLYGRGGDDKLDGGAGGDTMVGGSGDDEYIVDGVGDLVNEARQDGSGRDVVRVKAGISFDLTVKAQARGQIEDLYMDGATGFESIDGFGNGLDNVIAGNGGNNALDGRDGNDELSGAGGNDTLRGGAGADVLDGGAGTTDMADYSVGATQGVTVALDLSLAGTGDAQGDTFFGIERLRGTNFDDTLRGNNQANLIIGLSGADTITGGDGADRLVGGIGIDTLTGGSGDDRFEFNSLSEIGDIITDFIGYNDVPSIDDDLVFKGSAFGGIVAEEDNVIVWHAFQTRADNVAQDETDRFIFRTTDQTLWFDTDGNGIAAAVMVADFQAGAVVEFTDIIIV